MKKKIILLGIALISCFSTFAQLNVSTNLRMDFSWDNVNKEWKFESQDEESLTFFVFNKDFTLVKHTTASVTSAYMIKSQEHDEEDGRDQYIFDVVSDVGNKYMMIFDVKNDNIRFVNNDGSHMVKHRIKSTWKDE